MAIGTSTALLIGSGLSAATSLIGSSKAAGAQRDATEAATAEQRRQYDLTRKDFAPWREAGGAAIGDAYDMLQPGYDHTTSPGYQFRLDEGMRGIENSAAAKGTLMSGGNLKDLVRFSQGTAAGDYQDNFNRHMAIAGGGQQATTSLASIGANSANQIGNAMMQGGNARASGYVGAANAINGGLSNLMNYSMMGGFGGGTNPYGISGGNIY